MRVCWLLFTLLFSPLILASDESVLVIHSYHQGFHWTDDFQRGLDVTLKSLPVEARVLYLDSKRDQNADYLHQLYLLYRNKLQREHFSAVVVSDDNAFHLVKKLAPQLGKTPVIFGGVSAESIQNLNGLRATGILSELYLPSSIALVRRMQPDVKHIYLVTDHSVSAHLVRNSFAQFLQRNPELKPILHNLVADDWNGLMRRISHLQPQSAILYWSYNRNIRGKLEVNKDWQLFSSRAQAPVYVLSDEFLGRGAIGGMIESSYTQGRQLGELLERTLVNPNAPLPAAHTDIPTLTLDYQALERWHMLDKVLPSDHVINKPQSFFQYYRNEIKLFTLFFAGFICIIVLFLYYLDRLRRSEALSRESQILMASIFEQSLHYIAILDHSGRIISCNSKLFALLARQRTFSRELLWTYQAFDEASRGKISAYFASSNRLLDTFELKISGDKNSESDIIFDASLTCLPDLPDGEKCYLFEGRDITERKRIEQQLHLSESDVRHYYEQQPVMMVRLNENNKIQQSNHFAQKLLGYDVYEMIGRQLEYFYFSAETSAPRQVLALPNPRTDGICEREVEYRHANGSKLFVRETLRLLPETGHVLVVGADISQAKALSRQIEYQARYDLLTHLYNRQQFEIELQLAMAERLAHPGRVQALLYLDIDQLKVLNDTSGHEAGDAAIKFCASVLESVLAEPTVLARLGGDEFAIILKQTSTSHAINMALKILTILSQRPFLWEQSHLYLTCSIGIRMIDDSAESPQMVHAQADSACHAAKEEGRSRYRLYCPNNAELLQRQTEMECISLIYDALEHERIELYAQKISDLHGDDDGLYFEILARLRNSEGEYVSPGVFMPAAENYNIAHFIDKYIITHALDWLEARPHVVARLKRCSINLSGHSLGNAGFMYKVLARLSETSIPGEKICFEITETAAMKNRSQAIDFFERIKEKGCLIALDDFGAGLASFGYLKALPIDIVKIDGMFVKELDKNAVDQHIVSSINELVHQLGKQTVAEFVENGRIAALLQTYGVDYGQGYALGLPMPLAELVAEQLHNASE